MSESAKFWDWIAQRYAKRPVADEAACQKKLQITRKYLRPNMEVLEFGCGTGSTAIAHAPYVKRIQAIDISAKMLVIAREKVAANNITNVSFEQAGIDEFAAPDQTFDAVLGLSILHLLNDKATVIAKIYRMLKPGGVFVSSTACLGGSIPILRAILRIGRFFDLLPLVQFFTAQELEHNLTAAGFQIDHQWQPGKGKAVFIVVRKPG